jgi:SOS-response transcriptional repressor LexA
MLHDVTPRQHDLLEFVKRFALENGKNPSQNEIAAGIKTTQNSVYKMMQLLQDRGVIFRDQLWARQYEVVGEYKLKDKY